MLQMSLETDKHHHRLESLTRIVREVDSAADLDDALQIIVRRTRDVMQASVCTVYFTDHRNRRHVFAATAGLPPELIGHLQADFGQGLVGQVADSSRPINIPCVREEMDPDFLRHPETRHYNAFLGVPVTHKRRVQGVLVVRQVETRCFDDADEAFLTTLAAQLGGAIAYARANGEMCSVCRNAAGGPRHLDGMPGAPGIAVGKGVVLFAETLDAVPDRDARDPGTEERRFNDAVAAVRADIGQISSSLGDSLSPVESAVFDAYRLLLESPELLESVTGNIRSGNWAPGALRQSIDSLAQRFEAMSDAYLSERAADIRALGNRLLQCLQGSSPRHDDLPDACILVGRRLSAFDIGLIPPERLRGVIAAEGSALSHAAILARALGVPAVVGVTDCHLPSLDGQALVIDGSRGEVHLRPNRQVYAAFSSLIESQRLLAESLEPLRNLPTQTLDGVSFFLYTNSGLTADLPLANTHDSAGIGLFRSELPFMLYDRLPSEQEQLDLYTQVLSSVAPRPVNLRTLDAGGDKPLAYLRTDEANPALGWRGIRLTLDHPEIFLTQLRAALRANIGPGNLRLLFPMISDINDLEQALAMLEQAKQQLVDDGHTVVAPRTGLMIEVPSAILQLRQLAARIDFMCVGTNDLAQYLLATDRNNPRVSRRLDPCHPALLRALDQIVREARRARKPVTVCGEMANDPGCALLLLGMGFDGLSLSATSIPQVKWAIRSVTSPRMKALAEQALQLDRAELVHRLLDDALGESGLDHLQRSRP